MQETLCSSINDFVKSASEEVIGISSAQFYFLRDGGVYINEPTGEKELLEGKLFDAVVFNDSVREFLTLKKETQIILIRAVQRIFLTIFRSRKRTRFLRRSG